MPRIFTDADSDLAKQHGRALDRSIVATMETHWVPRSRLDRLRQELADQADEIEQERHHYKLRARHYSEQCKQAALAKQQPKAAPALAPVSPAWIPGTEVPKADQHGLWYWRNGRGGPISGSAMKVGYGITFVPHFKYRRAPDDAEVGDHYDENRYWQPNSGMQPVPGSARVDVRTAADEVFLREQACNWGWGIGPGVTPITHWRLSRDQS